MARFYILILFVAFSSCKSKQCWQTFKVTRTEVNPFFSGYNSGDLDTVVLLTYKNDGTFSSFIKQRYVTIIDSIPTIYDTPYYYYNVLDTFLTSDYDYKICISKINQTFAIHFIDDTAKTIVSDCNSRGNFFAPITGMNITGGNYTYIYKGTAYVSYLSLQK